MPIITRIWHGRTKAEHADQYLQFVIDAGAPDYKCVTGNLGVEIWRRIEGEVCHFWNVTMWESYESIKDAKYLLEFEPNVMHCETFAF